MKVLVGALLVIAVVVVNAVFIPGCEEAEGLRGLVINPSFADLTSGFTNFTQTFTVDEDSLRELSLPLEWSVANPQLGTITSSGGNSAAYSRTSLPGDNSIFVVDQFGAQGSASIRQ